MKKKSFFILLLISFQQSFPMHHLLKVMKPFVPSGVRPASIVGFNAARLAWLRSKSYDGEDYARRHKASSRGTANCLDELEEGWHKVVMSSDPRVVSEEHFHELLRELDGEVRVVNSRNREEMKDFNPDVVICFSPREVVDARRMGAKPIVVCREPDRKRFLKTPPDAFVKCIADVPRIVNLFEE